MIVLCLWRRAHKKQTLFIRNEIINGTVLLCTREIVRKTLYLLQPAITQFSCLFCIIHSFLPYHSTIRERSLSMFVAEST